MVPPAAIMNINNRVGAWVYGDLAGDHLVDGLSDDMCGPMLVPTVDRDDVRMDGDLFKEVF